MSEARARTRRWIIVVLVCLASPLTGFVRSTALPRCGAVGRACADKVNPWTTVEAAYDKISANFADSRRFPWPFVVSWLMEAKTQESLLVAGCGDGRHVQTALELGFDRVIALDLSQGMLKAAERRLGPQSANVVFLHGDTRAIPLPDACIQHILSCTSMQIC